MEKDLRNHNNKVSNLKRNNNEDSLEISSTGYGYESVLNQSVDEQLQTNNNPSCGGL